MSDHSLILYEERKLSLPGKFMLLAEGLESNLAQGDRRAVDKALDEVSLVVFLSTGLNDTRYRLSEIAGLASKLSRLKRRLKDKDGGDYVIGFFDALLKLLDRERTVTLMQLLSAQHKQEVLELKPLIVALLAGEPLDMRAIADAFPVDPSQSFRALKELEQEGVVQRADEASGRLWRLAQAGEREE